MGAILHAIFRTTPFIYFLGFSDWLLVRLFVNSTALSRILFHLDFFVFRWDLSKEECYDFNQFAKYFAINVFRFFVKSIG